ncbi:MAG TPA: hypothetical protein PKO09_01265 [Anaerolineae bacterium]|nr:hypothetical protein [Anaerolineae bacterium]
MRERRAVFRLVMAVMVLTGLACGPCNLLSREQPTPSHQVAVSTEAAGQLESRIQQNLSGQPEQPFILRMTDTELTSLLRTKLAGYDGAPVENLVIWFTKGKMYATGRLANGLPVSADLFLIASPRIVDGKVVVEIEELTAGALPLPAFVLDAVTRSLNETINETQTGVDITAMEILEGEAILKGYRKQP